MKTCERKLARDQSPVSSGPWKKRHVDTQIKEKRHAMQHKRSDGLFPV